MLNIGILINGDDMKIKRFFDVNIGITCILIFLVHFSLKFLFDKEVSPLFIQQSEVALFYGKLVLSFGYIIATSFCYGLLSHLITAKCFDLQLTSSEILNCIGSWFSRSLIVTSLIWMGFYLSFIIFSLIFDLSGAMFFAAVFCIFWSFAFYTFHPTLIVYKYSIGTSLIKSFKVNYESMWKWVTWYLLLAFLAGTYTFIWLPMESAKELEDSSFLYFWQIHGQWLGGYYFIPFWQSDLTNWLKLKPTVLTDALVILASVVISVLIKIKITQTLVANNYLIFTETKFYK